MKKNTGHRMLIPVSLFAFIIGIVFLRLPAGAETVSMLETGMTVNARMKSLAAGADQSYQSESDDIKAIRMADSLPEGFVPSDANTVSVPDSGNPVYIFFDNENDAGIMYFYTKGDTIGMNPDSSLLFANNTALADISGIAGWDSSHVINMYGLFTNARSLPEGLSLRNWDTSGVQDMRYMFSGCTSVLFIDVSNWDTGKVLSMAGMFQVGDNWKGNGQLTEIIGLGDLDVSNVMDMTSMFYGAGQMTTYDIGRWNVSKVESMNHMFCDNFKLRSLDLSSWDVSSLKTIYCMFDDNLKLKSIGDVSHWNTVNLIDAGGWLNGAHSFVGDDNGVLDISGWDTSNLKSAGEMFYYTTLHTIDLSGWTFDSITNELWEGANSGIYYETGNDSEKYMGLGGMFLDSGKLSTVYISQSGLDSYNAVVNDGVNIVDMWKNTKAGGFTVK